MAYDVHLKFEGGPEAVKGESVHKKHGGEIEVVSFTFGAHNSSTGVGAGGAPENRGTVSDMVVTKYTDKASTVLYRSCLEGILYPKAILTLNKTTGALYTYMVIQLEKVFVKSFSADGQSESTDRVMENLTLAYRGIEITYTAKEPSGGFTPVSVHWDAEKVTGK